MTGAVVASDGAKVATPLPWHVVAVGPAAEGKVLKEFKARGVDVWYPQERVWRRQRGRGVAYDRPLIRGYVFARLPDLEHLVHEVEGAQRLLAFAGKLAMLPDGELQKLKDAQEAGLYDRTRGKARVFTPGDRIVIRQGLFVGWTGAIARLDARRRVVVMVSMLRMQTRRVVVGQDDLEHAA